MSRVLARVLFYFSFCLCLCILQSPAISQVVPSDTTTASSVSSSLPSDSLLSSFPDSLRALQPDSLQRPALKWSEVLTPHALTDSTQDLISHSRFRDPVEYFTNRPGYFRYQQGGFGLPNHLTPFHLPAAAIGFRLDGAPIEDPLTNEIDWDFVPIDYATNSNSSAAFSGQVLGLSADSRLVTQEAPFTEMKYFTGSNGLQSIAAIHSQNRQRQILGQDAFLNSSIHYRGGAAQGEFTNSNYRHREIGARVLLATKAWFASLDMKSGNHRNGVNGGVTQIGSDYETIFERFGAGVNSSSDRRTKKRSQIKADLGLTWSDGHAPLRAIVYWQSNLNRFFSDTTAVIHQQRHAASLEQQFSFGHHRVGLKGSFAAKSAGTTSVWTEFGNESDLAISDRFELEGLDIHLGASLGKNRDKSTDAFFLSIERRSNSSNLGLIYQTAKRPRHYLRFRSFHPSFQTLPFESNIGSDDIFAPSRDQMLQFSLARDLGDLSFSLLAYLNSSSDYPFLATTTDQEGPLYTVHSQKGGGLIPRLSWRERARSGVYILTQISLYAAQRDSDFIDAVWLMEESIPKASSRSIAGLRYSLFDSELIMDSSLELRTSSSIKLLALESSSSLLMTTSEQVESGNQYQVDFWTDAEIRGATLYMGVENLLAPWLDTGSLSLDPYPLPDIAIRVGLLWPMDG